MTMTVSLVPQDTRAWVIWSTHTLCVLGVLSLLFPSLFLAGHGSEAGLPRQPLPLGAVQALSVSGLCACGAFLW